MTKSASRTRFKIVFVLSRSRINVSCGFCTRLSQLPLIFLGGVIGFCAQTPMRLNCVYCMNDQASEAIKKHQPKAPVINPPTSAAVSRIPKRFSSI